MAVVVLGWAQPTWNSGAQHLLQHECHTNTEGGVPVILGKMGANGLALHIIASYLKVAGSNDGVPE